LQDSKKATAACATHGITRLVALPAILPEYKGFAPLNPWRRPDVTLGWGLKASSLKVEQRAKRWGIPHIFLEDGFLRSWGLGVEGHQPHSVVVDHRGIYYDATRPSDLERLIQAGDFTAEELQRARQCMALLRAHRLSKYNHAPDHPLPPCERPRVLVVDQTAGDASIRYGLADAARFRHMLQAALDEHPDAEILVKIHPDVLAGHKQGHLLDCTKAHPRCRIIAQNINPWSLLDAVEAVHVVTSQLGFEALLAGRRVVCHGMPFYAGWGLTDDRIQCHRRGRTRKLEHVFAAAYLRYCRYANPYTGEASSLEETIELIAEQRRRHTQLGGRWIGVGFSGWKRRFVGDFLSSSAQLRHVKSPRNIEPSVGTDTGTRILAWSSNAPALDGLAAVPDCPPVWRMEDGFIRSVGLGVDLVRPLSLVIDSRGIHYDPRHPSDLEHLLETSRFSPAVLARARRLRQKLIELGLTKYNLGGQQAITLPAKKPTVLVVGQVETDASVLHAAPQIATNSELLRRVRQANPGAFILYKPHPDVVAGARVGQLDTAARTLYDQEVTALGITALLGQVDELHTMSSLAGFEALLRGVAVHTWGTPFYAGWGLTTDHAPPCPRRTRALSLDQLVAGTLILYPTYVDPGTGQIIDVETAVRLLARQISAGQGPGLHHRLYRWYRKAFIRRR
jgi:capsular polysaccharide export protein